MFELSCSAQFANLLRIYAHCDNIEFGIKNHTHSHMGASLSLHFVHSLSNTNDSMLVKQKQFHYHNMFELSTFYYTICDTFDHYSSWNLICS